MTEAQITDEQIIQIAHKYLYHYDTDLRQWEINEESIEDIIEFARAMYAEGYNQSYNDSKDASFKGFHTCLDD